MRKTIDLTEQEIKKVTEYQKRNGLRSFSAAIKSIIKNEKKCSCNSNNVSDDNFALLADAILKIDKKVESMLMHIAPKSAGEVK